MESIKKTNGFNEIKIIKTSRGKEAWATNWRRFQNIMKKIKNKVREIKEQSRLKKLRYYIDINQRGLEIGPSLRPVVPKREGYKVEIIDHLSQEELIKKYAAMGLDTGKIEEVDYIWNGSSYCDLTGKTDYYDYIIASHVIEHTADFVGFLQDCSKMLKENGVLSLAVPDKRYTLDHFRTTTTTGKMIDDYLTVEKNGSIGTLMDFCLHAVSRNNKTAWSRYMDSFMSKHYYFIHDHAQTEGIFEGAVKNPGFHDIHQYVFTPSSFVLVIAELGEYGLIDLAVDKMYHTITDEFIVLLRKKKEMTVLSNEEKKRLIKKVSKENLIK